MTPRLQGQNCKFFMTPLSCNSQKRLDHKENKTKYRKKMTRKPRSHVRISLYRTWAIYCIIVAGDAPWGAGQLLANLFPLSLATVPEVFANVYSAQFPLISKVANTGDSTLYKTFLSHPLPRLDTILGLTIAGEITVMKFYSLNAVLNL